MTKTCLVAVCLSDIVRTSRGSERPGQYRESQARLFQPVRAFLFVNMQRNGWLSKWCGRRQWWWVRLLNKSWSLVLAGVFLCRILAPRPRPVSSCSELGTKLETMEGIRIVSVSKCHLNCKFVGLIVLHGLCVNTVSLRRIIRTLFHVAFWSVAGNEGSRMA